MGGTVTSTHSSCAGLSGNRRGSSVQLGEVDGELLVVALRSVLQDADGNLNQKQYNTLSDDDKEVLMAAEERGLIRLGKRKSASTVRSPMGFGHVCTPSISVWLGHFTVCHAVSCPEQVRRPVTALTYIHAIVL
jgi:hypothetical protein